MRTMSSNLPRTTTTSRSSSHKHRLKEHFPVATDETRDLPDVAPEDGTGDDENGANLDRLQVLPLVALRDTVIFPEMIVPLQVGRSAERRVGTRGSSGAAPS